MAYRTASFLAIMKNTLKADEYMILQRMEDDKIAMQACRELSLIELNESGLTKAKNMDVRKKNIDECGNIRLITAGLVEWRGQDHVALTALGLQLSRSIYVAFGDRWPSGAIECKKMQTMITKAVGPVTKKPVSKMHYHALNRISELETINQNLDHRATSLQQRLDEEQAAETRRARAAQAQAALTRTQSIQIQAQAPSTLLSTPAKPADPTKSLPTPASAPAPLARHHSRAEPVSPSRPGPSSSGLSLGQDDDMMFFNDDGPAPDADELPPPPHFKPATPPPAPGPSNTIDPHAKCKERLRQAEQELAETRTVAEQVANLLTGNVHIQNLKNLFLGGRP